MKYRVFIRGAQKDWQREIACHSIEAKSWWVIFYRNDETGDGKSVVGMAPADHVYLIELVEEQKCPTKT